MLIDGVVREANRGGTEGWTSDEPLPADITLSFRRRRVTTIAAVSIGTEQGQMSGAGPPKGFEIWASTKSPTDGFKRILTDSIPADHLDAFFPVRPTKARFVRFRFVSTQNGADAVWLTALGVYEQPGARSGSILADLPQNIASPALGGSVLRCNGQGDLGNLIDESALEGWRSGWIGQPQDIVFSFLNGRMASVDRLVISPGTADADSSNLLKDFAVAVSMGDPFADFREVGRYRLSADLRDQSVLIRAPARYVRLRLLSNRGGAAIALRRVRIFAVTSAALPVHQPRREARRESPPASPESGALQERESNSTRARANPLPLGHWMHGRIQPRGDADWYQISSPRGGLLNVLFRERPFPRSTLSLVDPTGAVIKRVHAAAGPDSELAFSWRIRGGPYQVAVHQPRDQSLAIVWDTSNSMEGSITDLELAVRSFVGKLEADDSTALVRFGGRVEVVSSQFSSNRPELTGRLEGKFGLLGGTSIRDAVMTAVRLLRSRGGDRTIVLMTDGQDSESELSAPAFWDSIAIAPVRIYSIGLGSALQIFDSATGTTGRQFLRSLAEAKHGRAIFAESAAELKKVYDSIAGEIHEPSEYRLSLSLAKNVGQLLVQTTGEDIEGARDASTIELILDASGSMKRKLGGRSMMEIGKDVLGHVIRELPPDAMVALRVYGHRIPEGSPGDRQDSELLVPFAQADRAGLIRQINDLRPLGTTPIAYSLGLVPRDFAGIQGRKLVILVTDGKEEAGGDPEAVVADLVRRGFDLRLNIVGFALADPGTKNQMRRIANLTGGRFFDAQDPAELHALLRRALSVTYEVTDEGNERIATGILDGTPIRLPEGNYRLSVRSSGQLLVIPHITIEPNRLRKVALHKQGADVAVHIE